MREIKFRSVFFKYNGKFSHFSYWGFLNHKNEFDENYFKAPGFASNCERKFENQFIGLQDKNGKDIYESDKIKNEQGDIEIVGKMSGRGCYPFVQFPEYKCWNWDECEIIGDIYENPELIKS